MSPNSDPLDIFFYEFRGEYYFCFSISGNDYKFVTENQFIKQYGLIQKFHPSYSNLNPINGLGEEEEKHFGIHKIPERFFSKLQQIIENG